MEVIRSKENTTIKLYSRLSNSHKDRKRLNLFVLEGFRIVEEAIRENAQIKNIILSESSYARYEMVLQQRHASDVIVISDALAKRISSTENTQGIFAICEMPQRRSINIKSNGKYIILHQVQDPGNVGMIVRTADAFGLDGVIMSQSCELYSPKVIRSTMGSVFRVDCYVCNNIITLLDEFQSSGIMTYAAVIDSKNDIRNVNLNGGTAVVVGNEGNGLPVNVIKKCDQLITINMQGSINSLNVAMASGIIMWKMSNDDE